MEQLQTTNPSYSLINKDSMLQLASELSKLIKEKGLSSNIQGKQFVNVEGWQFAGASLGLMPIITSTQDLSNETAIKYMATCEVRNITTGSSLLQVLPYARMPKKLKDTLMNMLFYLWHRQGRLARLIGTYLLG